MSALLSSTEVMQGTRVFFVIHFWKYLFCICIQLNRALHRARLVLGWVTAFG